MKKDFIIKTLNVICVGSTMVACYLAGNLIGCKQGRESLNGLLRFQNNKIDILEQEIEELKAKEA